MQQTPIPVLVIDDTPVKLRGVYDGVRETSSLSLAGQIICRRTTGWSFPT